MSFDAVSIIYNPNSTGNSAKNAKRLKKELTLLFANLPVYLRKTEYAGHAEELAYEIATASKRPLIISSSGDGGYNEVVNGAMKAQLKGARPVCAVLASGNANDHSRALQEDSLLSAIKSKNIQHIDLLKITVTSDKTTKERYAHSYIGLGLTPVVAVELNKTDLNVFKELLIIVRTFYKYRPFTIEHKNKPLQLDSLIFANIAKMAKVLTLSNESKPDDGLFEIVAFDHLSKSKLLRRLFKATVKGLRSHEQSSSYDFTVLKDMPIQLDGEVVDIAAQSSVTLTSEHKVLATFL